MLLVYIIWGFLAFAALAFAVTLLRVGLDPILKFVKDNADFVKLALASVAAIYTAALYHASVEEKKVAATLEYSSKRDNGALRDALVGLKGYWIRGDGFQTLTDYRAKKIDNDTWAKRANEYVRSSKSEPHIMAVHELYRDIIACVDEDRCHRKTACQIFGSDVEDFRLTYRIFLTDWETAWQSNVKGVLRGFYSDCSKRGFK